MSGSVRKQGSLRGRAVVVLVAPLLAALVLAFAASAAHAAVGDAFLDRCLNAGATDQTPCTKAPGQTSAYRDVLSPDGKQLYLLVTGGSGDDPAILIFDRNTSTGALTRRVAGVTSCVTQSGSAGNCTQATQLNNPQDIAITPDGTSMYVSNAGTNSVIELHRSATGGLTLLSECQGTAAPCTAITGMGQPHAIAISPDGHSVYVRTWQASGGGTLLVFNRASDGTLTQPGSDNGCWSEVAQAGCKLGAGLAQQSWQIAATNSNVYVTGRNDAYYTYSYFCEWYYCPGWYITGYYPASGSVAIFSRNADGTLTQAAEPNGCISNNGQSGGNSTFPGSAAPVRCIDGNDALDQARGVTLSPDGKSVYVGTAYGIIAYSRGAGGALTQVGCSGRPGTSYVGCTSTTAVGDVYRMRVTPSGNELVASSSAYNGYVFLKRDAVSGALSERSGLKRCVTRDGNGGTCDTLAPLGGLGDVAISSDSTFLYLVNQSAGVLATMHRDVAPTCQSKTIGVPYQTSVAVPLTCSDINGDALALRITKQPTAGTLGGGGTIDPATKTVRYSPPLGFSGSDSFQYVAKGQNVDSAPATVTLNVGAAPPPPPGGGGGCTDQDGDGFCAGQDCNDLNPKINPSAREIPGNNIDENCDGFAAPLPDLRSSVAPLWSVKGSSVKVLGFTLKGLVRGWKVTVSCKGRGCPFTSQKLVNKKIKKGNFNALKKLKSRNFKAGQTLTVKFTAKGWNTKFSIFKFKKAALPSSQARCQTVGTTKLRACRG